MLKYSVIFGSQCQAIPQAVRWYLPTMGTQVQPLALWYTKQHWNRIFSGFPQLSPAKRHSIIASYLFIATPEVRKSHDETGHFHILKVWGFIRSRDSVVSIATGYRLDWGRWSSSPGMVKNFLFSTSSRPGLGSTQPPIQWVLGALSPGVKRPGREADHSHPASAEDKKMWSIHPLPHVFMALCLDKHRDNFGALSLDPGYNERKWNSNFNANKSIGRWLLKMDTDLSMYLCYICNSAN
jgi:hypothetical protein